MQVSSAHVAELRGLSVVTAVASFQLAWLFRPQTTSDFGIDGQLEVVDSGTATGRLVALQIKCGLSYFARPKAAEGWWFTFDEKHANYWLEHSLPVVVVLVDETAGRGFWEVIRRDTVARTGKRYRVLVPSTQPFDESMTERLTALAYRQPINDPRSAQQFEVHLQRLPPDVSERLRGLHAAALNGDGVHGLAALARRLADGSDDPADTCIRLLRSGLPRDVDRVIGWQIVGSYANEHRHPRESALAFERASLPRSVVRGRCRALAALLSLSIDRTHADRLLAAARKSGNAELLVSAAESLRAVPDESFDPVAYSTAVLAEAERAGGDPVIVRLVADQRARARDFDGALELYEALLRRLPSSASVQLALSEALIVNATARIDPTVAADVKRAVQLAELARADMRRWAGPSEEATELLVRAHTKCGDYQRAIRCVLEPPRGTATPREAEHEVPCARAAHLAYVLGRVDLGDELAGRVHSAGQRLFIAATRRAYVDVPAAGEAVPEQESAWLEVIAATSDVVWRLDSGRHLAALGFWPIKVLEDMAQAGLIDNVTHRLLQAEALAATESTMNEALVILREIAPLSLAATEQLAGHYADLGQPVSALEVLDRAADRSPEIGIRRRAITISATLPDGDVERRTLQLLGRRDLDAITRADLLKGLLNLFTHDNRWGDLAETAASYLELLDAQRDDFALIDIDTEVNRVAWKIVGSHFNRRDLAAAAAAYHHHHPIVTDAQEAHLWALLIDQDRWSEANLNLAAEYATRFSDAPPTQALLLSIIRGHARDDPGHDENNRGTLGATASGLLRRVTADLGNLDGHIATRAETIEILRENEATTRDMATAVASGVIPIGAAATGMKRPYSMLVVSPPAGIIISAGIDPDEFDTEVATAAQALGRSVAVDLSVLHLAGNILQRFEPLAARFHTVLLPRGAIDDLLASIRTMAARRSTDSLLTLADGGDDFQIVPNAPAHLAGAIASTRRMVDAATDHCRITKVGDLDGVSAQIATHLDVMHADEIMSSPVAEAWLGPIELALRHKHPLWCDDLTQRRLARDCGVPAFGTLALLHVLIEQEVVPDTTVVDLVTLHAASIVDLPLPVDHVADIARRAHWEPTAGAIALARGQFWASDIEHAVECWLSLAAIIVREAPDRLCDWLRAAAIGLRAVVQEGQALDAVSLLFAETLAVAGDVDGVTFAACCQIAESLTGASPDEVRSTISAVISQRA